MKKLLSAVLCLLLLASCTKPLQKETVSPVDPNDFHLDVLPEIGKFSQNDAYAVFDENVGEDFVPNENYGSVIPFIGSYKVYETPRSEAGDWHTEMGYSNYGFCNKDGKIIMLASNKNSYINVRTTQDGFTFYTVNREQLQKDDAPDEWLPNEVYIIPADGSWSIKIPKGSWVTNAGGGYIGVCEYPEDGSVLTHLYDYDGNLVRTLEGIDSVGLYSSGLMMVSTYVKGGYEAYFINEVGEKILGPYRSASDFNIHGITAVTDENGSYLINTKGERLTEYYDSFYKEFSSDMKKQVFSARHLDDNKKCDVYSDKGEFIGTVDGSTYASFRFPENGEIYYYYTVYDNNDKGYPIYNSERMLWKNLRTGEEFVSKEFGVSPNSYSGTDNCFINIDKETKKAVVFDGDGETIAVIDGVTEVVNTSEHGEYIIYTEGEYNYDINPETGEPYPDERKTHIYDSKKGKVVYSLVSGGGAYFSGTDKRFIMINVYNPMDVFGGLSRFWLFDTKTGQLLFEDVDVITVYEVGDETYINVCDKNVSYVYDGGLNLVWKGYFE